MRHAIQRRHEGNVYAVWDVPMHAAVCSTLASISSAPLSAGSFDEDEQRGMMESLRNASKNTMFDKWLSAISMAPAAAPTRSPPRSPTPAQEDASKSPLDDLAAYLQPSPPMGVQSSSQAVTGASGTFRPGWEVRWLSIDTPASIKQAFVLAVHLRIMPVSFLHLRAG